jgi:uroporphyrinogen-III synthase
VLVALTRERGRNEDLRRLVGERADVVETPLTMTRYRPLREVDAEVRASRHFGLFRSLVVTSSRSERYVAVLRDALIDRYEVFSVGARTSEVLERLGLTATRESSGTARDLAPFIREGPVLILGAVNGRNELVRELDDRDLGPVVLECYETLPAPLVGDSLEHLRRADVVFIGAPSAWRVASPVVSDDAWVLVPGESTLGEVRMTHQRVLVGWGEKFDDAWERITNATP